MHRSNQELSQQIRSGSPEAWAELFRRDRPKLLALASRFVSRADAEDVVQDAFVSTLRSREQFRGAAHPSTWLYRATVNAALMHLRTRRRRPTEALDDSHVERASETPAPDVGVERAQAGRHLAAGVQALKPLDRELFKLRFLDERSTEEAAQAVGLSVAAVKTRLSRARTVAREAIELAAAAA